MNLNRYQWTVPFLKSVPHILDPDRFQVFVHSKIFAIECIHNVFLRIRHGRNFQFHLSPMICSICYNNYIMFTVWNSVLHLEKLRKYYFGENREEWTLEKDYLWMKTVNSGVILENMGYNKFTNLKPRSSGMRALTALIRSKCFVFLVRDCRISPQVNPKSVHFFMNSRIFQKKSDFFTKKPILAHYLPQYSLNYLTFQHIYR